MKIYDFYVETTDGSLRSLSDMKGKVLLIVNSATGCGFTPQYEGLQNLYDKYKEKGLEILDFPCNQFGNQAPGTNKEVAQFCGLKYNTTFETFAKVEVNGEKEIPLYTYLKQQQSGMIGNKIKWNFTKFLVDREGHVVRRYGPTIRPEKIKADIEKLL